MQTEVCTHNVCSRGNFSKVVQFWTSSRPSTVPRIQISILRQPGTSERRSTMATDRSKQSATDGDVTNTNDDRVITLSPATEHKSLSSSSVTSDDVGSSSGLLFSSGITFLSRKHTAAQLSTTLSSSSSSSSQSPSSFSSSSMFSSLSSVRLEDLTARHVENSVTASNQAAFTTPSYNWTTVVAETRGSDVSSTTRDLATNSDAQPEVTSSLAGSANETIPARLLQTLPTGLRTSQRQRTTTALNIAVTSLISGESGIPSNRSVHNSSADAEYSNEVKIVSGFTARFN